MPTDERSRQLGRLLASKAAAGRPVMDPVSMYLLGMKGGGNSMGAPPPAGGEAVSPPAAPPAPPAPPAPLPRRGAMDEQRRMRAEEEAVMQHIMDAMVYSPSVVVDKPPGFVSAGQLGLPGAGKWDDERGGVLQGLDTRKLSPQDMAWLQAELERQQKTKMPPKRG